MSNILININKNNHGSIILMIKYIKKILILLDILINKIKILLISLKIFIIKHYKKLKFKKINKSKNKKHG
jgi:hypothetical protein